MWAAAALLLTAQAAVASVEVIDLDLPPEERWRNVALKYRSMIIARAAFLGRTYEFQIGPADLARWVKAAPVSDELMAEYKGIVRHVNDPQVTLERLIILDMWHAVEAPTFGCSGLLAAMSNGTVIQGRNLDYDSKVQGQKIAETVIHDSIVQTQKIAKTIAKTVMSPFLSLAQVEVQATFDGLLVRAGRPIASFIGVGGSLGMHTGIRLGDGPGTGWSIQSNARIAPNNHTLNLLATEAGSKNFPWLIRQFLQEVPDYKSALESVLAMNVNAPNYFILAGAGPYQGAVVTKDRGGLQLPDTPPPRYLSAERGVWYLLQTNDDVNKEPIDDRRNTELKRLSGLTQDGASEAFVLAEMMSPPLQNWQTLITWMANPAAGTCRTFSPNDSKSKSSFSALLQNKPLCRPELPEPSAAALWHEPPHAPPARVGRLRARSGGTARQAVVVPKKA